MPHFTAISDIKYRCATTKEPMRKRTWSIGTHVLFFLCQALQISQITHISVSCHHCKQTIKCLINIPELWLYRNRIQQWTSRGMHCLKWLPLPFYKKIWFKFICRSYLKSVKDRWAAGPHQPLRISLRHLLWIVFLIYSSWPDYI